MQKPLDQTVQRLVVQYGNVKLRCDIGWNRFFVVAMALATTARRNDIAGQAHQFHQLNFVITDVDFPPAMLHGRGGWIFVMVVVPAFTDGQDSDEPVVATVFARFIVAVAEHVAQRIHGPSNVPHANDANDRSPHYHARAQLSCRCEIAAGREADQSTEQEVRWYLSENVEELKKWIRLESHVERISQ